MIKEADILPSVLDKFLEWRDKGYKIILTTARPEGCRDITKKQLYDVGIFFDKLIMGLNTGPRVIINDKKINGSLTSYAINLERDIGLENLEL
jgi:hypothetical protein